MFELSQKKLFFTSIKSKSYFWDVEIFWEKYYKKNTYINNEIFFPKEEIDKNINFEKSDKYVFKDENDISYKGLKKFSLIKRNNKYIFLVDNHHKILTFLYKLYKKTKKTLNILHIDAHRDDAIYKSEIPIVLKNYFNNKISFNKNFDDIFTKFENQCRICDYLDAGKKIGLINNIFSYTQSFEIQNNIFPKEKFILNLDIDIFGEEGSSIALEDKVRFIAKAWNYSSAICIAMSPGFIDFEHAKKIIEILTK